MVSATVSDSVGETGDSVGETGDSILNSSPIRYVHFHTITFGKVSYLLAPALGQIIELTELSLLRLATWRLSFLFLFFLFFIPSFRVHGI